MLALTNEAEVLSTTLWWSTYFYVGGFGFSMAQAARLMKAGLSHMKHLWNEPQRTFYSAPKLAQVYHLKDQDQ